MFKITPEEAVAMWGYIRCSLFIHALNIAIEFKEQHPDMARDNSLLCATMYHAGMVDGIRRERARNAARKAKGMRLHINVLLEMVKSEKTLDRLYRYIRRH